MQKPKQVLLKRIEKLSSNSIGYYVAISRAKNNIKLFVDNDKMVIKVIEERSGDKSSAIEGITSSTHLKNSNQRMEILSKSGLIRGADELIAKNEKQLVIEK